MKKKLLSKILMVVITASMLLTGCGEQKTDAENVNSTVAQESEAYVQNEEGEKSYTNIDWAWSVSDYELYNTMMKQEEVNSELFSGIIDYSDGHQETVKADSVNLIWEDGSTMVVEVEFRGKKFPYKVEIKDGWGDGESLSEEQLEQLKQEEQEQGSEVVDTSGWKATPTDCSDFDLYYKVRVMNDIYDMWERSIRVTNKSDVIDCYNEGDYKGKDLYYTVEVVEKSEWEQAYGNADINDVYKAWGLREYGKMCECFCESHDTYFDNLINYYNLNLDMGTQLLLKGYIDRIPLSEHETYSLPADELREYTLYQYIHEMDDSKKYYYYKEPLLLALYGLTTDDVKSKFVRYNMYPEDSVKLDFVYGLYTKSEDLGYEGSIFDFYNEETSVLDSYVKQILINEMESINWQNLTTKMVNHLNKFGVVIPDYATYKDESNVGE